MFSTAAVPARLRSRERSRSVLTVTTLGWLLGLLVTALILWSPYLDSGFRSPYLHLALDTADACVALLAAYLVHGRVVRAGRWQDFLLSQGLLLLGLGGLGLNFALRALPGIRSGTLDVWLPLTLRTAGALLIGAAALAGGRIMRPAVWRRWSWLALAVLLTMSATAFWLLRTRVPVALSRDYIPGADQQIGVVGHPALLLAQGLAGLSFLVASAAFAVQSTQSADRLLFWLGPACALAGFARVNYILFPSLYSDWLYTGDLLRSGCYLLLLIGAAREMRRYWTSRAEAAVLEDRRRLARELHDSVVQELAYIRAECHRLPADPTSERLIAACDRALDESRAAVHALGRPSDEALGFVIHRAARELAERYKVDLEVDVDDSITAEPEQTHALMRITREAVSNAVRHGKADRVHVRLTSDGGERRLAISDDGSGFDVQAAVSSNAGYGLVSMRDRATMLPGSFDVMAEAGSGSVVTVTW